ncbi:MAG: response regulator transcription factor [Rubrivivax sp.]|nr:response regulator transcription factor [Rubrivivax sp.]
MTGPPTHRQLLVIDDHPLVREALVALLESQPGWQAEGVADAPRARERCAAGKRFDALLADYRLPQEDGLSLLADLRLMQPQALAVLLSGAEDARLVQRARLEGLDGFLSKSMEPREWLNAVRRILAGERCFPAAEAPRETTLTERQLQVLQRVCEGQSNKQIARDLGLSERTVKDHLALIFARLSVSTRAEAVARAAALGLLSLRA